MCQNSPPLTDSFETVYCCGLKLWCVDDKLIDIRFFFYNVKNVKFYKAKVIKSHKTAVVQSADMSGQKTLKLHAELTYKVKKSKKKNKKKQPNLYNIIKQIKSFLKNINRQ